MRLKTASQVDLDRLPDADREPGQPNDGQPHDEEHGSRRGVRQLALDPDEPPDPATRADHAVEEEHDPARDAGQPKDEPRQRIDQLQQRQPAPEVSLPGVWR